MKPTELRIFAFALLVVLGASEALLAHNVLYTEGEIVQGLYWIMVSLNVPLILMAMWKPKWGLWGGMILAALLLPWQTAENRKWAQIHEEVIEIIRFVETTQETAGEYPDSLAGYDFQQPWVAKHIAYTVEEEGYYLSYFMDDDSISYWYESTDGFGYYPD
ncbi:MAG: hypothetical protein AAFW84_26230 [Cyanobacteria bacterium J06635_15]